MVSTLIEVLTSESPVVPDLGKLVSDQQIELDSFASLDSQIVGQLELFEDRSFKISANKDDHKYRKRFTIAHELGHWFRHRDLISLEGDDNFKGIDDDKAFRSTDAGKFYNTRIGRREESEANQFAAVLLMPKKLVLKHHKINFSRHANGRAFQCLYHYFQVSPSAMRWRLKGLGLATDEI